MLLMELLKPCVDYCNVPPDSMKNEGHIFHSYVTESNLHGVRDYAYRDIFVVMRESTVVSFPTLSTYIVPKRNNKQVSESCLITTGALGISRQNIQAKEIPLLFFRICPVKCLRSFITCSSVLINESSFGSVTVVIAQENPRGWKWLEFDHLRVKISKLPRVSPWRQEREHW